MLSRDRIAELVRYLATGGACIALNVAIVTVLTEYLGLHYLVSLAVCFATVTFAGFVANRYWTFRKHDGVPLQDLRRYALVTLANTTVSMAICSFLVSVAHVQYAVAVALTSVILAPAAYVVHRGWSFRLAWLKGGR